MKKKLFFTGSTGILGCNWLNILSKKYDILSTSFKNDPFDLDIKNILLNKTPLNKITNVLKKYNPDIIIHTAAFTNVDLCQKNKQKAFEINVNLTKILVNYSKKYHTKLVFISSDHIFDGFKSDSYSEKDKPSPINIYAETKVISEKYIINNLSDFIIIRTNFFGLGNYYKQTISENIINNLKLNIPTKLFDNIYFNPLDIDIFIKIANKLIDKNKKGIFNLSSNKKISKYQFGILLAKKFKLNHKLIIKNKYSNKIKITDRPLNMSISNKKIIKIIDKKFLNIDYNLNIFKHNYDNNYFKFRSIIPYGKHYLFEKDIDAVTKILRNKNLTQGNEVLKFEQNVANYVGAKYAIAISSASAGLHLSFKALQKNQNTKLYTSPITFVASSNSALHCNSEVLFLDIDKNTLNLNHKLIKQKFSKNSDVIMPVHFAGAPCSMKSINIYAKKYNYKVIEDAAHAFGSKYEDGSRVGNCKYSDLTVFSFHPVKPITSGEGGVITTNNFELYKKLLRLRSHGINKLNDEMLNIMEARTGSIENPWYYEMTTNGFNYRLTDIQCSLANSQLKSLNKFIDKRRKLANRYDKKLKGFKNLKSVQNSYRHLSSHHLYVVRIDFKELNIPRAVLMNRLKENGILTQVHYIPVPIHPYYSKLGYNMINLKNSQNYYEEALSLPLYYDLSYKMQDFIIDKLRQLINT